MTIGPAPMIRIDLMSVRFGTVRRFPCHSGAPRSGEPGIQMLALSLLLDSGSGPSGRPGMTESIQGTKKGRAWCASPGPRRGRASRASGSLDQIRLPGKGEEEALHRGAERAGSQRGFAAQIHRARNVARAAHVNCARMKAMTPAGAIPAKVSDSARARVTAGLAKDVEAVNQ